MHISAGRLIAVSSLTAGLLTPATVQAAILLPSPPAIGAEPSSSPVPSPPLAAPSASPSPAAPSSPQAWSSPASPPPSAAGAGPAPSTPPPAPPRPSPSPEARAVSIDVDRDSYPEGGMVKVAVAGHHGRSCWVNVVDQDDLAAWQDLALTSALAGETAVPAAEGPGTSTTVEQILDRDFDAGLYIAYVRCPADPGGGTAPAWAQTELEVLEAPGELGIPGYVFTIDEDEALEAQAILTDAPEDPVVEETRGELALPGEALSPSGATPDQAQATSGTDDATPDQAQATSESPRQTTRTTDGAGAGLSAPELAGVGAAAALVAGTGAAVAARRMRRG